MQVHNFRLTSGTLREFQDFWRRLEATLEDSHANNNSNKASVQDKGHKKHRCNNNNNKGIQQHYSMLHGHNQAHSTNQCRTLKKETEKVKKFAEIGNRKNKKCNYNPTKEEIHVLAKFSKEKLKMQCNNVDKELKNFENVPVSDNGNNEWKTGPGLAKSVNVLW